MARIMIICPETGKPIYTHLNFDRWNTFETIHTGKSTVQCPKCGRTHTWEIEDTYMDEDGGGG